jgi:lysophospholipase L1-like esterase
MPRRRGSPLWAARLPALALAVALAVAVSGCEATQSDSSSQARATAPERYVGLGDSFSAGTGTRDSRGPCQRSPQAFPALLVGSLPRAKLQFVACAGRTAAEILVTQTGALSGGTSLVTVTAGGNDARLLQLIGACASSSRAACRSAVGGTRVTIASDVSGQIGALLAEIMDRAPRARVVVVGYPRLFGQRACSAAPGLDVAAQRRLNGTADDINAVLKQQAAVAGAIYASTTALFRGHGVCSRDPWITGASAGDGAFHPTAAGQRYGMLVAARHALGIH